MEKNYQNGLRENLILSFILHQNELKDSVTSQLQPSEHGGFGKPGASNAFLIAMLLYLPGTMQVDGAETKLSPWLFNIYQELFAQALNTSS